MNQYFSCSWFKLRAVSVSGLERVSFERSRCEAAAKFHNFLRASFSVNIYESQASMIHAILKLFRVMSLRSVRISMGQGPYDLLAKPRNVFVQADLVLSWNRTCRMTFLECLGVSSSAELRHLGKTRYVEWLTWIVSRHLGAPFDQTIYVKRCTRFGSNDIMGFHAITCPNYPSIKDTLELPKAE